jgi:hypothetical protein
MRVATTKGAILTLQNLTLLEDGAFTDCFLAGSNIVYISTVCPMHAIPFRGSVYFPSRKYIGINAEKPEEKVFQMPRYFRVRNDDNLDTIWNLERLLSGDNVTPRAIRKLEKRAKLPVEKALLKMCHIAKARTKIKFFFDLKTNNWAEDEDGRLVILDPFAPC